MRLLQDRWRAAQTLDEHIATAQKTRELWDAVRRRARVTEDAVARVTALGGRWHLLALSEEWCGDSVNTLPVLAALAEAAPNLELRVLERDRNPDLMDSHLTDGKRSIPLVMVLDERFAERGRWGPRPAELQRWMLAEGLRMEKPDRYREVRRWYARDGGRTTLEEIVAVLEAAARPSERLAV